MYSFVIDVRRLHVVYYIVNYIVYHTVYYIVC